MPKVASMRCLAESPCFASIGAARAPGPVRVDVIGGGHDLGGEGGADLAGRLVADFLDSRR
jgi:hypothetical protein